MIIIWSNQAKYSYENIIDNLLKNWNIEIVLSFEKFTNELLDNLKTNKKLCPVSKQTQLRKCVIHKNISLIYRITKKGIELVTFIFNKSDHKFYL